MIEHNFKLDLYNWEVVAFYDVREDDLDIIIKTLLDIGCNKLFLQLAISNIEDGLEDNGFTFTNFKDRISVLVIGYSNTDAEAMNTLVHEARHLELHISKKFYIEENSEERYYLMGKLVQTMYKIFKLLL